MKNNFLFWSICCFLLLCVLCGPLWLKLLIPNKEGVSILQNSFNVDPLTQVKNGDTINVEYGYKILKAQVKNNDVANKIMWLDFVPQDGFHYEVVAEYDSHEFEHFETINPK